SSMICHISADHFTTAPTTKEIALRASDQNSRSPFQISYHTPPAESCSSTGSWQILLTTSRYVSALITPEFLQTSSSRLRKTRLNISLSGLGLFFRLLVSDMTISISSRCLRRNVSPMILRSD